MANVQQVTGALRRAGKRAQKWEKGIKTQDGYSAQKWIAPGAVVVLVNSHDTEEIADYRRILASAGFLVWTAHNTSIDVLFVKCSTGSCR